MTPKRGSRLRRIRSVLAVAMLAASSACIFVPPVERADTGTVQSVTPQRPDPAAPRLPGLPTRRFAAVPQDQEVLGELQVLFARDENTFVQIARRHDLGFEELRLANPDVDVWIPGEGTPVYLPTMTIIPVAPRDGIVLNLPSMRLLYFSREDGADADTISVTSHPIGIGREGWATPTGRAEVTQKARDPVWYPPASVRAEHAELGDPLPSVVPPGPDNPLGKFALALSLPGYLIHGTNKPAGVGMRVSHGCIRLYPEDIEALFERVPPGTPVYIVDQPVLAGWQGDELYLEVHRPLSEDARDLAAEADRVIAQALERAGRPNASIDSAAVARIVEERVGMPFPILGDDETIDQYLANARLIENDVPVEPAETTASR